MVLETVLAYIVVSMIYPLRGNNRSLPENKQLLGKKVPSPREVVRQRVEMERMYD